VRKGKSMNVNSLPAIGVDIGGTHTTLGLGAGVIIMFGDQEYSGVEIILAQLRAHSGVVGAAAEFFLSAGA
jgi:hypothetical protein